MSDDAPEVHVHTGEETAEMPPIEVHVDAPETSAHDHTETILEHHGKLENHESRIADLEARILAIPGVTVQEAQAIAEDVVEEAKEELAEEAEVTEPEPEPEPEHHESDEPPHREHPWFRKIK